jgi:hypothetical protein
MHLPVFDLEVRTVIGLRIRFTSLAAALAASRFGEGSSRLAGRCLAHDVDWSQMERGGSRCQSGREFGKPPTIGVAMSSEYNVKGREVDFGEVGGEVDRTKTRRCLAESDPSTRRKGNDAAGVVGVSDDGTTEPDLATTT